MQPSPHNQQSSPHPVQQQPYTNLPHQSPTAAPYPAPAPARQAQSAKSPGRSSGSRAQQQQSVHQQQHAQYMAQYSQWAQYAQAEAQAAHQARQAGLGKQSTVGHPMFGGGMFPPGVPATTVPQWTPGGQQYHGHSSQASSLSQLQRLTQGLDLPAQVAGVAGHVPHASPPPVPPSSNQKTSKSSKSRSSGGGGAAPGPAAAPTPATHLALGYPPMPHYPGPAQQLAAQHRPAGPAQARPPNVTIPAGAHPHAVYQQAAALQYQQYAMLSNPLVYQPQHYDQRSVPQMTYPGYGASYNYHR